jgi:hypothetical protein
MVGKALYAGVRAGKAPFTQQIEGFGNKKILALYARR